MAEDVTRPQPNGHTAPSTDRPTADDYAPNALPSVGIRIFAFVCILVAGVCGGIIGYAFVDLQSKGDNNAVWTGIGTLGGAIISALGVAVVVTLALRAMGEWRTIQHQDQS